MEANRNAAAEDGWARIRPLVLEEGRTAQVQVYGLLRNVLMSGHLRPGEEISLRHAASALGTSVTPVREALRQIESEGGLEVHGRNRVLRVPVMTAEELAENRDIRIELEGMATETATRLISPGQMRLVTNACRLMQRATENADADLYLENNWRFHSLIYKAANRPILFGMIEGLWMRAGPLIRLALHRPGHLEHSMECHRAAEAALKAGDSGAARAAIARDISGAAQDLGEVLQAPAEKRRSRR